MGNKENFLKLVSSTDVSAREKLEYKIANRDWLRESKKIAFFVLSALKDKGWTQKDLAEKMNVSPQQVHKIIKGNENLTLKTLTQLQKILEISIINHRLPEINNRKSKFKSQELEKDIEKEALLNSWSEFDLQIVKNTTNCQVASKIPKKQELQGVDILESDLCYY